jgi:hypothetical protein
VAGGGPQSAGGDIQAQSAELEQLQSVGAAVCESVFGVGPSTSSVASQVTDIPNWLECLVADGIYHGLYHIHICGVALPRPQPAISKGFAFDRTEEELDTIEAEVVSHAQTLCEEIDPKVVIVLTPEFGSAHITAQEARESAQKEKQN